jgi:two-component system, NarL family, nitrate/nitrite response regulator NarL
MGPITIILADDHPVVLQGLASFLQSRGDFAIVATCSDGAQCLDAIRHYRSDLALVDMSMPRMNGLELLAAVNAEKLSTRIVLLSASFRDSDLLTALKRGAGGIIIKDSAPDLYFECLREVAAARHWCSPELTARISARTNTSTETEAKLTRRERDVVALVADGLSNKDIARRLDLTEGTVKIHLHNIFKKLDVTNRTALAALAFSYRDQI